MHPSALDNCETFFDVYSKFFSSTQKIKILDIGSLDINGSLKSIVPHHFEYTGVDFQAGKGVDILIEDPYALPFQGQSFDIVLSSSCFEHAEMFWLSFLEIMRVLKPLGLFYLNAPSNGVVHRYPVDCWRFYPDSGRALVNWAKKNSMNIALLESYTSLKDKSHWNDFVAIFLKDEKNVPHFPNRILDSKTNILNGLIFGSDQFIKPSELTEDMNNIERLKKIIQEKW